MAHELGLAAGFGGQLFGKLALNPAVRAASPRHGAGLIVSRAWNAGQHPERRGPRHLGGHLGAGRSALSGKEVDRVSRGLVLAKDVRLGSALGLGLSMPDVLAARPRGIA